MQYHLFIIGSVSDNVVFVFVETYILILQIYEFSQACIYRQPQVLECLF